ncbi:MAG: flagellin lysine-N-methylase [Ruminococcus sp.]|nr:flagellin lysine-N-methylase [Ruminococcus sp.]
MLMIFRTPGYYGEFRCIADKCSDNCCIGWEIDIDSETMDYYSSVDGSFGDRLKNSIKDGSFVLTEGERCPFLNSRNLCDIYTELGEAHLCQICTDHPRFYEWFGDVKEGGVGLCCEAAAKLILSEDMTLTETVILDEDCDECDSELYDILLSARDTIIKHLQNDSFPEAVCTMLDFGEKLQFRIDNGDFTLPAWERTTQAKTPDIQAIMEFYASLEPIDENWRPYIERCMAAEGGYFREHEIYLRRIAVYSIFRFFMKGVFDGEIISRVKLAAVSAWMVGHLVLCEGREADIAGTAKNYSKEVEYSEENLEALADAFYEEECFSTPRIMGMFADMQVSDIRM